MICCDRCGKEIKRGLSDMMHQTAQLLSKTGKYEIKNVSFLGGNRNVVLCSDCQAAFQGWMVCPREDKKVTEAVYEKGENGVETHIYDQVEEHHGCYVQILSNSVTGEKSFGWQYEDGEAE